MVIDYAQNPRKRRPLIGRPTWIFIIAAIVVFLAKRVWYPYTPAGRQARNMEKAAAYLPTLASKIRSDSRFAHVETAVTTAADGAIAVVGYVDTDADVAALHAITDPAKREVNLIFSVKVSGEAVRSFDSTTRP